MSQGGSADELSPISPAGQDTPGPGPGSESGPAPTRPVDPGRIRRNTACVRCRDAKVKCNASTTPGRPCFRCTKLELDCVVDKSYKRTSRRSKLEELAAEVQTIKDAVAQPSAGPRPMLSTPALPELLPPVQLPRPHHLLSPQLLLNDNTTSPTYTSSSTYLPPPANFFSNRLRPYSLQSETPAPTPVRLHDVSSSMASLVRPAEPRALGSRVFSGDEINYYFEKYFEHFHPYLPIVRSRDPDAVYKRGPVLFWAIIMTACRRFARDDTVFQFLIDTLLPEIWNCVSQPPLRLPIINSLLLVAAWPSPSIRFLSDPSIVFAGIAMNSSFLTGLHTGRGAHPEFKPDMCKAHENDEEAIFTWGGCAIVSHRVSAYMGCPSSGALFNKSIDTLLDGSSLYPIPRYFAIHLETSRFSNRVSRTMSAALEEARGVSHHLVSQMEDEYTKVQSTLYPDNSDLDNFTILSTLLEIQTYYFMPLPGHSPPILHRNLLKAFTTAEALIHAATALHRASSFLHYAPYFVFRTLLSATCVVMSTFLSPQHTHPPPRAAVEPLVRDAVRAMRAASVQDGDLHVRVTNMLEKYWDMRAHITAPPPVHDGGGAGAGGEGEALSVFTCRLGASLTFGYLRRCKRDVEAARDASTPNPMQMQRGEGVEMQEGLPRPPGPHPEVSQQQMGLTDAFNRFDWNAFMDDFDWSFTSSYLQPGIS